MTGVGLVFLFLLTLGQAHSTDFAAPSSSILCFSNHVKVGLVWHRHRFHNLQCDIRLRRGYRTQLYQSQKMPEKLPLKIDENSSLKKIASRTAIDNAVFNRATDVFNIMKLLATAFFAKSTAMLHRITTYNERLVDVKGMPYAFMHSALCFVIFMSGLRSASASHTSTAEQITTHSHPAHNAHVPSSQHRTLVKPMLAAGFASSAAAAAVSTRHTKRLPILELAYLSRAQF